LGRKGCSARLLVAGAITIYATDIYRFFEIDLFAVILLIQSLPSRWGWRDWSVSATANRCDWRPFRAAS